MSLQGPTVSRRTKRMAPALLLAAAGVLFGSQAWAGCWSVLKSPKWAAVQASLRKVRLCEALPAGPNRTDKLQISAFDVCDAPGGLRFHVQADLRCKSKGLIQITAKASVKADVAVDIGTCTVTEAKLDLGGDAGQLLAGQPAFQSLAQGIAQAKLSELCGR